MKIALIREKYRPDGGAERIVSRILDGLREQTNIQLSLLTRQWQGDNNHPDLQLIQLNSGGHSRLSRIRRFSNAVSAQLSQLRFDLIQSHERIPGAHIYRAGDGVHREWLMTRIRHGGLIQGFLLKHSRFHRWVMKAELDTFTHPEMHRIVCISRLVKDDIQRHYPQVDSTRLQVIYNGIDLNVFQAAHTAHCQAIREQLHIPAKSKIMLAVGSGFERKGFAAAVRALAELDTNWQLIIVGKDRHQHRLRRLARRLGVETRLHLVGVQTDLPPWYTLADVLVHPALYEPFGNVILEAMACGTAVCASDRCGGAELIEAGKNGMVCKPDDAQSLAQALITLEGKGLADLGQQARLTAERYSLDTMKDAYLKLYQQILPPS